MNTCPLRGALSKAKKYSWGRQGGKANKYPRNRQVDRVNFFIARKPEVIYKITQQKKT